ncbi:MAG: MBL fold metallo-hydrolase [Candidatus Kapabacteria bacterium]|nr:MBL fold metallo-hydrolase [Candidatus Kapabacteria bacterium]
MILTSFLLERFVISTPPYKGAVSDHFNGDTFFTPGAPNPGEFSDLLKWVTNRDEGEWLPSRTVADVRQTVPNERIGTDTTKSIKTRITFVNHATMLIQTEGINILTDPVWADVAGVFDLVGAKRVRPAGVPFENLPKIDLILLSHNHYDHLDIGTMKRLAERFKPTIIVPLGNKAYLEKNGIGNVQEYDWWQQTSFTHNGATMHIHCVPAQHFSGRGVSDRNKSLWCGFVLQSAQTTEELYFAGDSGYGAHFARIGEKFRNIVCAMIPIGAFRPRWFMSPVHIGPEEAVKAHQDVHARQSLAMHFGTFPLADDGEQEPMDELKKSLQQANINEAAFRAIDNGEWIEW